MTRPTKFSFQVHFSRGCEADHDLIDQVVRLVRGGGARVTGVSVGKEDGKSFATINAEARDAYALWQTTKSKLKAVSQSKPSKGMIVVCEGAKGWDDYILLQHFDKRQKIDKLNQRSK